MSEANGPTDPPHGFEAALRQWGGSVRIEARLTGGYRKDVWQVRLGRVRYAACISSRSAEALEWEFDLLDYLRASGLSTPQVAPTLDGRRHVEGVFLYSWLKGDPPTSERDWALVAHELARLHALTQRRTQRPGFLSTTQLLKAPSGGDVRLDLMPAEAVALVRNAWRAIADEPTSVVHGDPGSGNIRISGGKVGLLDWDEARVDASALDFADLPSNVAPPLGAQRRARIQAAADAWEAANGWLLEPAYARRRLARLEQRARR